jgi:hypothetical protein
LKPTARPIAQRIFDYVVFGNWLVGLVAVAFLCISDTLLHNVIPVAYYALLFFASVFLYSLQRVVIFFRKENWESTTRRHAWLLRNKKLLIGQTAFAGLAAAFVSLSFFKFFHLMLLVMPALVVSLTYALPLFPVKGRWVRLRDFPFVKIFLIAAVWVYLTVFIALLFSDIPVVAMLEAIPFDMLCWGFELFLLIVALTIPFDIRDLPYEQGKVKTIPGVMGWRNARLLAMLLLFVALGFRVFSNVTQTVFLNPGFFAALLWYGCAATMLLKTNPSRGEYFYSFGMDGLFVLYALLLMAAGNV